jgi:acyl carrier protein|tara:strand:+ start:63 stop:302 length:240 start_codon:yes stop_codon:yes gene_type:complete
MNNKEKYDNAFIESLVIKKELLNDKLIYNSVPEWDSIGHMSLVSTIEEAFDISMETNDIIDFSSYKKGIEILNKYKVII